MTKGKNNKVFKTAAGSKHDEYKKGLWDVEEDKILKDYVTAHGTGHWNRIAKKTGLKRCGKSCRLRWMNYLSPNVKHENFSEEEEDLIIRMHRLVGNRWSLIAKRVPGRTDNQVKNHWNTHLSKKLQLLLSLKPINTTTTKQEGSVCPKADDHHDHSTIFQVDGDGGHRHADQLIMKKSGADPPHEFVFSDHEKELLDDPISFLMDDDFFNAADSSFKDLVTSSSSLTF